MARLMLSWGMFSDLAARMAPRRRGLVSGSPPPFFAAILISLMRRVKILPRLASSAPFLCLIVAHFEWPDIVRPRVSKDLYFKELRIAQDSPSEEIKVASFVCWRMQIIARRYGHAFPVMLLPREACALSRTQFIAVLLTGS